MNQQNLNTNNTKASDTDANRDPITGKPGAHPVGTGLGAVGVGAAGGAIGGPLGAAAGAVVGAVAGGLAGKTAAEAVNPTIETKFWQDGHSSGPFGGTSFAYEEYAPAYRYGWESFGRRTAGQTFENAEADLGRGWDKAKEGSRLGWDQAKEASRGAWNRVEQALVGRD